MHDHFVGGLVVALGVDVYATAVPSVLAGSCVVLRMNGAATVIKIAGPPSKDNGCVRLIVLF